MPVADVTRVVIELPQAVLNQYERQGFEQGLCIEDLLSRRLTSTLDQTSSRGLYFNDAQREELEQALGGGTFKGAEAVLKALTLRYTVRVQDAKPFKLEEGLYTTLKERSNETKEPLADIIARAVRNGLMDEAWGSH